MSNKLFLFTFFVFSLYANIAMAKIPVSDSMSLKRGKPAFTKFYIGNSFEGPMLSNSVNTHPVFNSGGQTSTASTYGTVRFSWILNFGFTFNYNFNQRFGCFTGIDLKNLGFIEKLGNYTVKHRTYNLGVPVGIKMGNMAGKGRYVFLGTGLDLALNYREKGYTLRNQKIYKFSEWFSDRTPLLMPYVFAGIALPRGVTLKAQYYPNGFLNADYTHSGIKPYDGEKIQIMYFTVGFTTKYGKKHDFVKKHVSDLNTM